MPSRIALCGLAGSGKSTAADYFVSLHGFKRLSYAAPIKRMLRSLLIEAGAGFMEAVEMTDGKLKELPSPFLCGHSPRYALQTLGTEFGREIIGPDIWRRILLNKVRKHSCPLVVDDARFGDEIVDLRQAGFLIVRIDRGNCESDSPARSHSSEKQELPVDLTIQNDSSVEDLHIKLQKLLEI
jgi:hypothetical protein